MPWVSMVLTKPEFTVAGMESLDTKHTGLKDVEAFYYVGTRKRPP